VNAPQDRDEETPIDKAWNSCPGLVRELFSHQTGTGSASSPKVPYSGSGPARAKGNRRRDESECDEAMVKSKIHELVRRVAEEGYSDGKLGVYPQEIPAAHCMRLVYTLNYEEGRNDRKARTD